MIKFSGKKDSNYINQTKNDYKDVNKIIKLGILFLLNYIPCMIV